MRLYKRGAVWWVELAGTERRSTGCTTRATAELYLKQIERDNADPANAAARAATIDGACGRFLEALTQRDSSPGTLSFYATKVGHLARVFGPGASLSTITAPAVDAYIAQRLDEGVTRSTVSKELVALRGVLKTAKRRGEFPADIAAVMPVAFATGYKPREGFLTPEQLERLLTALETGREIGETPPKVRAAAVAFMVGTGARASEMRSARRSDVDLEGGLVHLRGTKTEGADRVVPLTHLSRSLVERAVRDGGEDILFPGWAEPHGALKAAAKRADVPYASPNDLRRTCATWLDQAGVPHEHIAKVLGHKDTTMVARVYGKASASDLSILLNSHLEANGRAVRFLCVSPKKPAVLIDSTEAPEISKHRKFVGSVGNDPTTKGLKGLRGSQISRENSTTSEPSVRELCVPPEVDGLAALLETLSLAARLGDFELVKRLASLAEKLTPAPANVVPLRGRG